MNNLFFFVGDEDLCAEQAEVLGICLHERESRDLQDLSEEFGDTEEREDLYDESNRIVASSELVFCKSKSKSSFFTFVCYVVQRK